MSERFCFCGAPVPAGRSKYCSAACSRWIHNRNIATEIEVDDEDEGLPTLPHDYVGAWLTPDELRVRNAALERLGKRICRTHQSSALPLDAQHFKPRTGSRSGTFETECRACLRKRESKRKHEKYHSDPEYVRIHRAKCRTYYFSRQGYFLRHNKLMRLKRSYERIAA
jgi:hypothetical protein